MKYQLPCFNFVKQCINDSAKQEELTETITTRVANIVHLKWISTKVGMILVECQTATRKQKNTMD